MTLLRGRPRTSRRARRSGSSTCRRAGASAPQSQPRRRCGRSWMRASGADGWRTRHGSCQKPGQETREKLLRTWSRTADELKAAGKSAGWKLALAAALKSRTTATNRWLSTAAHFGNLHEVSRKVAAWTRASDAAVVRNSGSPKTQSLTPFSQTAVFRPPFLTYLNIEPKNGRK